MTYPNILFCLLLLVGDVPTSAQERACDSEQLINVDVLVGHPSIVPPYKPGHVLVFRCTDVNMTMNGQRAIECLSDGKWDNPFPKCEEITCELNSIKNGVQKIEPEGKTIFRAGESVTITCAEKHWLFGTTDSEKSCKCLNDGKWSEEPACVDITCEIPHNQHVASPWYYFRRSAKLGATADYYCDSGYKAAAPQATCTREGWTPNPLCAEIACLAPDIPNAEIEEGESLNYRINSRINYRCHSGFTPDKPVQITCNSRGEWTNIQRCVEKPKLCGDQKVENGFTYYSNEEQILYSCKPGYKPFTGKWWDSVTCSEGGVLTEKPQCIREEECGALPKVKHGKLKKTKDSVTVECKPGFEPKQRFIKCNGGTWETPVCDVVGVQCGLPPKVENTVITSKPESFYMDGSTVTYHCPSPFQMSGGSTVSCRNGSWEKTPTCTGEVFIAKCQKPEIPFMTVTNEKETYDNKDILTYKCVEPYTEIEEGQLTCENGKWVGQFVCTSKICPPPPNVENAIYRVGRRDEVITKVTYTCNQGFELEESPKYYSCINGRWQTPPKCLKSCEVTSEIMEAHNMDPIPQSFYLNNYQDHRWYCKSRLYILDTGRYYDYMDLNCVEGKLNIKKCQKRQ